MKSLGIIGGGITGLTCAYKLQNDFNVTLFEKDTNFGGQAQTIVVDGISVESAVSVIGELTYIEFYKLMKEIDFDNFESYSLTGLHVRDRNNTKLYIDINPKRLIKVLPKFLLTNPLGFLKTFLLIPFVYRLYADYRKGKLKGALVLDAYTLYPRYSHLITTVLNLLSLITAVEVKNVTIEHVLNFIFDTENNKGRVDPLVFILKTFIYTMAPKKGVGEYIHKIKEATQADFIKNSEIVQVKRNSDSTVTIIDSTNTSHTFDKVIIATQPFQAASFLDFKNPDEEKLFKRLSKLVTYTMVTNHTDSGILDGLTPPDGLVDFKLDYHENTSQTTITRDNHFYTAQTLPDNFDQGSKNSNTFFDTSVTNDNYSIDANKILYQSFHGVQHMTPETSELFKKIVSQSGNDNLHFACSALSNYPTSQEGGVRSALRVAEELLNNH